MVFLEPVYKPLVHRQPPVTRIVKKWSTEAEDALRDCFDTTRWELFSEVHGEDIDALTDTITDYMNFCEENTVPTRTVRCFSNNKPWINPDIKALLKEKKRAFMSRNREELKAVQIRLRRKIREGKKTYRTKLENQLQASNVTGVWRGLKTISGHNSPKTLTEKDKDWADELNSFFNRFDKTSVPSPNHQLHPLSLTTSSPPPPLSTCSQQLSLSPGSCLSVTTEQVRNQLRKMNVRKAAGPDKISSRLLRTCSDQLCDIVQHLFNLSLKLGRAPQLWKTSCLVPVPKNPHPKKLNSYRPVALTSHLMKTLERLVLAHLRPLVSSALDPLQFAYQSGIGVEDAIIYLLHSVLSHLEKAGSTVRIMFFDFSSAFNTIQPNLLRDKLQNAGVDHHLTAWIIDYLTNRPQFVRVQSCESDRLLCSTGAPQGTVLAPFLFILYTSDFRHATPNCHLQKFSDDSAIVGLITEGDDREYKRLTKDFVDWCQQYQLQINPRKTKELVVDFCRQQSSPALMNIQGMDIERVTSYKYLGVLLNNKLDWSTNTDTLIRKGQSRLFLLRKLRSFGVQGSLLKTFYNSVVASAIHYGIVCWSGSISARDRKRLERLVRKAGSVLGCSLDTLEEVGNSRMLAKLKAMLDSPSHPLQPALTALGSSFSQRLLHPRCKTERYRRSFLPTAVRLLNKK